MFSKQVFVVFLIFWTGQREARALGVVVHRLQVAAHGLRRQLDVPLVLVEAVQVAAWCV